MSKLSPYRLHSVSVHLKYLQTVKATPVGTKKFFYEDEKNFVGNFSPKLQNLVSFEIITRKLLLARKAADVS